MAEKRELVFDKDPFSIGFEEESENGIKYLPVIMMNFVLLGYRHKI